MAMNGGTDHDVDLAVAPYAAGVERRAALFVADQSTDPGDCEEMLRMLGLLETPRRLVRDGNRVLTAAGLQAPTPSPKHREPRPSA